LVIGAIVDLSRSRADLKVENPLLRQQNIVLHQQIKQPQISNGRRFRPELFARYPNAGIMQSSLSNPIRSFAGIESCSVFFAG
jgi:hypothetical protein